MQEQGVTFTNRAARRIGAAVEYVEQHGGARMLAAAGPVVSSSPMSVLRVDSATVDSDGNYPATVMSWSQLSAGWTEFGDAKLRPANGDLLTNGEYYLAVATGDNSSGEPVYIVAHAEAAGLTVEGRTGTPSYDQIHTIQLDLADGFDLTNPLSRVARIDLLDASATVRGVVSAGGDPQGFGGAKIFNDNLGSQDVFRVRATSNTDFITCDSNGIGSTFVVGIGVNTNTGAAAATVVNLRVGGAIESALGFIGGTGAGVTCTTGPGLFTSVNTVDSIYYVNGVAGVGGTDPVGNVFVGGILTSLGTGGASGELGPGHAFTAGVLTNLGSGSYAGREEVVSRSWMGL